MDKPLVSIIIPYFNEWILTHARLMELYNYAPRESEIILVDDASTETEPGNGISWWKNNALKGRLRYYRNPENVGFGKSNNNGAKLAKGKYIIFISNDVVMYGDFITDVIDLIGRDDKMLIGGRIVDWAGGWNEFDINGRHYVIPYAEGWMLGCTKVAWKGLGGFDTRYGKFDYEDLDLSTNALSLGYNIVGLDSNKLKHLGSQTITKLNINRQSITEHNRELFIEKWKEKIPILCIFVR